MRTGGHGYVADARDAETGESWTVIGPTEYEATLRLAEQVGIELTRPPSGVSGDSRFLVACAG